MERNLLEQLYHRYYRELYVYVYSLCRRKSVTDDILQETFLKAFLALKDSHTNMRAWLYMVARNLYYNYEKKERSLVPLEVAYDREEAEHGGKDMLFKEIIRKEEYRELWAALRHLSVQKREVLALQYFGGFSLKEIAAMMKLTPSNVRVLSHRAKKELKGILGESFGGERSM